MSIDELEKVRSKEIQEYIHAHEADNVQELSLHHKDTFGLPFRLIANQIVARKKAASKVPSFYKVGNVIYPPVLNLGQSSSEATAKFKVKILMNESTGKSFLSGLDLTGGFGIDSYFLSQVTKHLDFVEPNAALLEIARHNFNVFQIRNVTFKNTTAEDFLAASLSHYDFIFLDPSRRDSRAKKVFRLADCQPDVHRLLPPVFDRTEIVLIKASPLLDIHQALSKLTNVKNVIIVSIGNECKELLFLLQKGFMGEPAIETYNLAESGEIKHSFFFTFFEENSCLSHLATPELFLYEPNASILKAGAFKSIAMRYELKKLHPNTHLYTSSHLKRNFPGRVFKIESYAFEPKNLVEKKANVIVRNYPIKAEALKEKLGLSDGGDNYVIGFSGIKKKHLVIATRLE